MCLHMPNFSRVRAAAVTIRTILLDGLVVPYACSHGSLRFQPFFDLAHRQVHFQ